MGGGGGTGQEFSLNNLYYNRKPKSVTSFNSHFFMPADCSFRSWRCLGFWLYSMQAQRMWLRDLSEISSGGGKWGRVITFWAPKKRGSWKNKQCKRQGSYKLCSCDHKEHCVLILYSMTGIAKSYIKDNINLLDNKNKQATLKYNCSKCLPSTQQKHLML